MKEMSWKRNPHSHRSVAGVGPHSSVVPPSLFGYQEKLELMERSTISVAMKAFLPKALLLAGRCLAGQHQEAALEV